jgi:pimeloyl-ACP methyl ester carboxylesterase
MTWLQGILLTLGAAVALVGLFSLAVRAGAVRADPGGCGENGLAVFCGGLRWFGVRWGLRSVPAGLREAGFGGQVVYWQWHEAWQGWLALPALKNRLLIEREAQRAAAFIGEFHRKYPDAPVYLLGCSAGGFVALRALELLPDAVKAQSAALLSPAFDGGRDLTAALSKLSGPLVISSSRLDWIVLGLGTLVFGNADGRHSVGAGMIGVKSDYADRIREIRWRPGMILAGRLGGHASATPPAFIARYVAPAMGIGGK